MLPRRIRNLNYNKQTEHTTSKNVNYEYGDEDDAQNIEEAPDTCQFGYIDAIMKFTLSTFWESYLTTVYTDHSYNLVPKRTKACDLETRMYIQNDEKIWCPQHSDVYTSLAESMQFGSARNDQSKVIIIITNIHIAKSRRKRHMWPIDESFMELIR